MALLLALASMALGYATSLLRRQLEFTTPGNTLAADGNGNTEALAGMLLRAGSAAVAELKVQLRSQSGSSNKGSGAAKARVEEPMKVSTSKLAATQQFGKRTRVVL